MATTAILGKTCAGKNTIANYLISQYGYKRIITYTSRHMREGEEQDVDYHFISKGEFLNKIKDGFFAEWKVYNTKFGFWYYGTSIESIKDADDNTILIITPDGYRDIKKLGIPLNSIYVYADNETIKKRLIERGDDEIEANRRLKADNIDFDGIEDEVSLIVSNVEGIDINKVTKECIDWLEYRRKRFE